MLAPLEAINKKWSAIISKCPHHWWQVTLCYLYHVFLYIHSFAWYISMHGKSLCQHLTSFQRQCCACPMGMPRREVRCPAPHGKEQGYSCGAPFCWSNFQHFWWYATLQKHHLLPVFTEELNLWYQIRSPHPSMLHNIYMVCEPGSAGDGDATAEVYPWFVLGKQQRKQKHIIDRHFPVMI